MGEGFRARRGDDGPEADTGRNRDRVVVCTTMPPDEPVISISSQHGLHPDEVARRTFPAARRGLDPEAVRRYLETLAQGLSELLEREQELRRRLADAERRAEAPELDEQTLLRAVGAETARILQAAHEAAASAVSQAEARAQDILAAAEEVMGVRTAAAEARAAEITELASAAASARAEEAREETEAIVGAARAEAVELLNATRAECRQVVRAARVLRAKVLSDLTERRRVLRVQLEQLGSGRDSLLTVVDAVGTAVDDLRFRLESAEQEARVAATEAGERAETEVAEDGSEELEAVPEIEEAEAAEAAAADSPGDDEATAPRSVDELFARIRANREPEEAGEAGAMSEEVAEAGATSEEAGEVESTVPPAGETVDLGVKTQPVEGEPAAALERRTVLLSPVTTGLSRSLKRALQDDQNILLDALRHASGPPDLDSCLPEPEQRARIEAASRALLAEAWTVGYGWLVGGSPDSNEAEDVAGALASELAGQVTLLLRRRLVEALLSTTEVGDGTSDVASAAYREWRGARIEATSGDFTARAFSNGALAGGRGSRVVWIVDDDGQPCPDCDDNALAGVVVAGEEFPTGQLHPPVHPGCRCLLVAASS